MKTRLKTVLGFLISAFCLWLVLKEFNWADLRQALNSMAWKWLIPAGLVYCAGFINRTFRWKIILGALAPVSAFRLFPILCFGYLLNNMLPARAGEFAKGYLSSKLTRQPVSSCLGTIAVERISDFVGLLFIAAFSLNTLPDSMAIMGKIAGLAVIGLMGLGTFFLVVQRLKTSSPAFKGKFAQKISDLLFKLAEGVKAIRSIKLLILICILSILIWVGECLTLLLVSRAFGINLSFFHSSAMLVGISLGVMIPAAPGYIGTYEFFALKVLGWLGYAAAVVTPFVLINHFFQFVLSSLLGLLYFVWPNSARGPLASPAAEGA